jgi:hypothetical protein
VGPAATNPIDKPNPDRLANSGGATVTDTGGWWGNGGGKAVGGIAAGLLVLCIPWLVRTLIRRRRFARLPGRAGVEGLWAEIRDSSRDLGLDWSETATPRQLGDWLTEQLPDTVRPEVIRLARGVESIRYAGRDHAAVDLRKEAATVRRALWTQAKLARRWRARLLPPSWRWYLSRGSAEASDLLDEFDLALARLRTAIVPRRPGRHAG